MEKQRRWNNKACWRWRTSKKKCFCRWCLSKSRYCISNT